MRWPAAMADFTLSTSRIWSPRTTLTVVARSSCPRSAALAGRIAAVAVLAQPAGAAATARGRVVRAPCVLGPAAEAAARPAPAGGSAEIPRPPEHEAAVRPVATARTASLFMWGFPPAPTLGGRGGSLHTQNRVGRAGAARRP